MDRACRQGRSGAALPRGCGGPVIRARAGPFGIKISSNRTRADRGTCGRTGTRRQVATVGQTRTDRGEMSGDADAGFTGLAREYLDDRAERHPDIATGLGDHRFDARLPDPSAQALDGERRALDSWAARLAAVDDAALSPEHRVDAAMMAESVARRVFEIDELREHTWNPLQANPGKAI